MKTSDECRACGKPIHENEIYYCGGLMRFFDDNTKILDVIYASALFYFCSNCFNEKGLFLCPDNATYCSLCFNRIERPGSYWTVDVSKEKTRHGVVDPEWGQSIYSYHDACVYGVDLFVEAYEGLIPFVKSEFKPRHDTYILGKDKIHECGHKVI